MARPKMRQKKKIKPQVAGSGDAQEADGDNMDAGGMDFNADTDDGDGGGGQHKGHHHVKYMRMGRKTSVQGIREDMASSDAEAESGASTAMGISRKGMGGGLGDDGFDDGQKSREAYESYLKGNVEQDAARFAALREGGAVDKFNPELPPKDVEALGNMNAANHLVRMYDHWMLQGKDRMECISSASTWLSGFEKTGTVKKVLTEMESKPIRDVYPVEVMSRVLDEHPESIPSVKRGSILGNTEHIRGDKPVYAGHKVFVPVPKDMRLKGFALLGGARPGYEFFPSPKRADHYELLVDTPGEWTFALAACPTKALGGGKIMKEADETVLETFTVNVQRMGKKDGDDSAVEGGMLVDSDHVDAGDAGNGEQKPFDLDSIKKSDTVGMRAGQKSIDKGLPAGIAKRIDQGARANVVGGVVVGSVMNQARNSLKDIVKDPVEEGEKQTYSLEKSFVAPGKYKDELDANEIFHVSIDRADPFDPQWKELLSNMQAMLNEWEPGAKAPTDAELKRALRRALPAKD